MLENRVIQTSFKAMRAKCASHPIEPGEHHAALRTRPGHPLEHDLELAYLPLPPGEFWRPLPGAGRVRVSHRVHESDSMASSSEDRRFP